MLRESKQDPLQPLKNNIAGDAMLKRILGFASRAVRYVSGKQDRIPSRDEQADNTVDAFSQAVGGYESVDPEDGETIWVGGFPTEAANRETDKQRVTLYNLWARERAQRAASRIVKSRQREGDDFEGFDPENPPASCSDNPDARQVELDVETKTSRGGSLTGSNSDGCRDDDDKPVIKQPDVRASWSAQSRAEIAFGEHVEGATELHRELASVIGSENLIWLLHYETSCSADAAHTPAERKRASRLKAKIAAACQHLTTNRAPLVKPKPSPRVRQPLDSDLEIIFDGDVTNSVPEVHLSGRD